MAYDREKTKELIDEIQDKYGKHAIFQAGKANWDHIERISTGLPDLDWITNGGWPSGRIVEIFGPESAGKTSLAYHIAAQVKGPTLFIDAEHTFDSKRAEVHGVTQNMIVRRPEWGEQAVDDIISFSRAGFPLIIVDSVPALIPRAEADSKDSEKQTGIGQVARLMSRRAGLVQQVASQNGTSVIFINQVRDKIGIVWGDTISTPGGHALKHAYSLRVRIQRKSWLKKSNERYGILCRLRIDKSKVGEPMREAEIPLFWDKGFVDGSLIAETMDALHKARRKAQREAENGAT